MLRVQPEVQRDADADDRDGLWDCTSPNWQDHWTSDAERYCWSDYQRVLDAIGTNDVVTDPKSVAEAWGRTGYTPPPP